MCMVSKKLINRPCAGRLSCIVPSQQFSRPIFLTTTDCFLPGAVTYGRFLHLGSIPGISLFHYRRPQSISTSTSVESELSIGRSIDFYGMRRIAFEGYCVCSVPV